MKMKTYNFTYEELTLLRDAAIEYYQFLISGNPCISEGRKKNIAILKSLVEQFKDDCRLFKA